jgi:hypothetical protein
MAIYPTDAVGSFTTATFTSMANRKPDRGYSERRAYDIIPFTSEAGYEKRTLRTRRSKRSFSLRYSNIDGLMKQAIENFYIARNGEFESFTFDLSHVGQSGTINVRFDGDLNLQEVKSGNDSILDNVYDVSFTLLETYT